MIRFFNRLALAISYVTCVPISAPKSAVDDKMLEGLAKYLPTVGLLIGLLLATLAAAANCLHTNGLLAAGILTFTWLWLTGGLHMDGFMDTADGVYSHRSRERMLEIMQDSRVGNFAVLAAISALALKIFALASLSGLQTVVVLLIVPAWSRACEVYAIGRFPYAREFGKGKVWHDTTEFPRDLIVSILPVLAMTALATYLNPRAALTSAIGTCVGGVLTAHWLNRTLGGHTGDTYGAVIEAAEVAGIVLLAITLKSSG